MEEADIVGSNNSQFRGSFWHNCKAPLELSEDYYGPEYLDLIRIFENLET